MTAGVQILFPAPVVLWHKNDLRKYLTKRNSTLDSSDRRAICRDSLNGYSAVVHYEIQVQVLFPAPVGFMAHISVLKR